MWVTAGHVDHGVQTGHPGPDPSPGEKHWRRLNGHQLMAKVIDGVKFTNGVPENAA